MLTSFEDSPVIRFVFKWIAPVMSSRFRHRFWNPIRTLQGAGIRPGQQVLEVGCGTGFFTIPAAQLLGEAGCLYSIDLHPLAIEQVGRKVREARLTNVRLAQANALSTRLDSNGVDLVLLFGVIPAPTLPLDRLLPEMHRVLKQEGALAVWTGIPWWSPASVTRSGLFKYVGNKNGVHNFSKIQN